MSQLSPDSISASSGSPSRSGITPPPPTRDISRERRKTGSETSSGVPSPAISPRMSLATSKMQRLSAQSSPSRSPPASPYDLSGYEADSDTPLKGNYILGGQKSKSGSSFGIGNSAPFLAPDRSKSSSEVGSPVQKPASSNASSKTEAHARSPVSKKPPSKSASPIQHNQQRGPEAYEKSSSHPASPVQQKPLCGNEVFEKRSSPTSQSESLAGKTGSSKSPMTHKGSWSPHGRSGTSLVQADVSHAFSFHPRKRLY